MKIFEFVPFSSSHSPPTVHFHQTSSLGATWYLLAKLIPMTSESKGHVGLP